MNMLRIAAIGALVFSGQLASGAGFLAPQEFVTRASAAGLGEVELGKLAVQKGSAAHVRAFAQKMIEDHGKSGAELAALAKKKALKLAAQPGEEQRTALAELRGKTGSEFDAAWIQQMVKDHDQAVSLFSAAGTLDDADLAGFARNTLPTLTEHQQMAAQLAAAH
jgi:putative membrane protein